MVHCHRRQVLLLFCREALSFRRTKKVKRHLSADAAEPLSKALYTNLTVTLQRIVKRRLTRDVERPKGKISAAFHFFACAIGTARRSKAS